MVGIGDVAALIGGAPPRPGRVVCSLGSSSMIFMALADNQRPTDPAHRLYIYPLHPYRLLGGVSSTTGAALTWAYTQFGAGAANGASFASVMAESTALEPGTDGLCFIPYLAGERSPYWQDELRGGFYGFRLAHDYRHLVRAVMEGVAYSLRHLLDIYGQLGVPVRELALSGGGTQTPGLCQILADVCGLDAAIYAEEETVTRVLYALYRTGLYGTDMAAALDGTFPEPGIVRCDPARAEIYARGYASYRRFADFALAESSASLRTGSLHAAQS
jgi:sugar (pentulose or hexulose) kinase